MGLANCVNIEIAGGPHMYHPSICTKMQMYTKRDQCNFALYDLCIYNLG